jgi:hypothetical protein
VAHLAAYAFGAIVFARLLMESWNVMERLETRVKSAAE